jgi:hypothetical protein
MKNVSEEVVESILEEVKTKGPLAVSKVTSHGTAERMSSGNWKSTNKLSTMALDILWAKCDLAVVGRSKYV